VLLLADKGSIASTGDTVNTADVKAAGYSLSPRSSCAVAMEGLSPTAKAGAVVTSSRASKRRYVQSNETLLHSLCYNLDIFWLIQETFFSDLFVQSKLLNILPHSLKSVGALLRDISVFNGTPYKCTCVDQTVCRLSYSWCQWCEQHKDQNCSCSVKRFNSLGLYSAETINRYKEQKRRCLWWFVSDRNNPGVCMGLCAV